MKAYSNAARWAAAGLLASAVSAGAVSAGQGGVKKDEKPARAPKAPANPDSKFIMEAAMGGMAEVRLGELATKQAADAQVKQFGQHMVDDHSKANDELKQLASGKGIALPADVGRKHQAVITRLSGLRGPQFDRAYMSDMVTDHREDVAAFERESRSGKDPEIKAWAAKTLPTLQEHLRMALNVSTNLKTRVAPGTSSGGR